MEKLAINGGEPVRTRPFPNQNTMDHQEQQAVIETMQNGRLSQYQANAGQNFQGGPNIKSLKREWCDAFKSPFSTPCNSATSGLFIACAAINLRAGDEVIVTPYSMTCSATIPLWFKAMPIFADIEEDYFTIDPKSIASKITSKTKAIITVDLFGQPCNYKAIKQVISEAEIVHGNKIWLITDTAQAPGSKYGSEYSGTIGDIGVFSLNFGKHMTCGEGGMIITKSESLYNACELIMNHAEAVVNDMKIAPPHVKNMIGLNLRMTELQAAIARVQLKKLDKNISMRLANVFVLNRELDKIPAISPAKVRKGCTHTYYVAAYLWDKNKAYGGSRSRFLNAVKAELTPRAGREEEGIQIGTGYIKPIYKMPWAKGGYNEGIHLPVVEDLYNDKLFLTLYHAPNSSTYDMKDIAKAFHKCWENIDQL